MPLKLVTEKPPYINYIYTVIKYDPSVRAQADAFMSEEGFPAGNQNDDGTMIIVDKSDDVKRTVPSELITTKPAYVVEEMSDWPYLTHAEAKALIAYNEWKAYKD